MRDSNPPPSVKKPQNGHSSREEASELEVEVRLLSEKWNAILTGFFRATAERTRLYWLIASLDRHNSVRTANAMAFDLFLGLVPMLGLAGWTAAWIVRSRTDSVSASQLLMDLTPAQIDGFIGQHFESMSKAHLAPFAALAGWWLVSSAFNTMMSVFQETFACRVRTWVEMRLVALAFALFGMVVLGVGTGLSVVATVAPPAVLRPLFDSLRYFGMFKVAAILLSIAMTASFFAILYRYSISRPGKKRRIWAGAWTATVLGAASTVGLGYYASNIARYALFYGGLAAIIVVLLWLWLWSTAILMGAEINIAMEDVDDVRRARADDAPDSASRGGSVVAPDANP